MFGLILKFILLFLILFGLAQFLSYRLKIKSEFLPVTVLTGVGVIMFLAGLLNMMPEAVTLLTLFSFGSVGYIFLRERSLKNIFSPGLFFSCWVQPIWHTSCAGCSATRRCRARQRPRAWCRRWWCSSRPSRTRGVNGSSAAPRPSGWWSLRATRRASCIRSVAVSSMRWGWPKTAVSGCISKPPGRRPAAGGVSTASA